MNNTSQLRATSYFEAMIIAGPEEDGGSAVNIRPVGPGNDRETFNPRAELTVEDITEGERKGRPGTRVRAFVRSLQV